MNFDSSTGYKVSLSKLFNQPVYLPKVSCEDLKTFFFQKKKWRFLTLDDRKRVKTSSKKGQPIKKPKSGTWPIFPYIYLNFEFFDEN